MVKGGVQQKLSAAMAGVSVVSAVKLAEGARLSEKYDGRPGGLPLADFEDKLRAEFAKQESKGGAGKSKLTTQVFLRQLPAFLAHEALEVWRENREEILTPRAGAGSSIGWDPLEEVFELFRKEFEVASAEKIFELQRLKRLPGETCRMLKGRLKRLSRETGLLNAQEQARSFVKALPRWLREQVEPVLFAQSPGGVYTLEKAFEIAERIDLARAFQDGVPGGESDEDEDVVSEQVGPRANRARAERVRSVRGGSASVGGGQCFRCGSPDHKAADCTLSRSVRCGDCGKLGHAEAACWNKNPSAKPEWLGKRAEPEGDLRAEVAAMKSEMGELRQMIAELLKRGGGGVHARSADVVAGGGATLEDWEVGSDDETAEERARREQLARIHGYD